ncbi:MAG: hypothetical protein F4044_03850 [Rhodobacteraceae bacterium]|nr:hypothetical protein [Paracoccaceae bacterium]
MSNLANLFYCWVIPKRSNNLKSIDRMDGSYDFIVIDWLAKLESMLAAAIKVSGLVLILVQPFRDLVEVNNVG